jgi:hypothetical protein
MHNLVISISLIFLSFSSKLTEQVTNPYMYVPIHSLRKSDICSILSIAILPANDNNWKIRVDSHHSRRTMLHFLLSIKSTPNNKYVLPLINECFPKFDWTIAEKSYMHLKNTIELYQEKYHAGNLGKYWELKISTPHSGTLNSREYISRYRLHGFKPNELKIYWNYNEIQKLSICNHYNPITDSDANDALLKSPVSKRIHSGTIRFIIKGIQDAVFNVPHGNQVIVLDFADERMPGGYYLEHANTQEEVRINILFDFMSSLSVLNIGYSV